MKVSELGEFGLIDLLSGMIDTARDSEKEVWRRLILGIGDDAPPRQPPREVVTMYFYDVSQCKRFKFDHTLPHLLH